MDGPFTLELGIVDTEGRPVSGVTSSVIHNSTVGGWCSWPHPKQLSDASGRIDIPNLDASTLGFSERLIVSMTHPDYAEELLYQPERIARDGSSLRRRIVLGRGDTLSGVVRGGSGAKVTAYWLDDDVPACHCVVREALATDQGVFTLSGLRAGVHNLVVSGGVVPLTKSVRVPGADIELYADEGIRVTALVLGDDGEPLAGADVRIETRIMFGTWETTSGPDGRIDVQGVAANQTLEVRVEAPAADPKETSSPLGFAVVAPTATDVHLEFDARQRVRLRGVIVDAATGEPLPGWSMLMAQPIDSEIRICPPMTFNDARFDCRVPRGRYAVAFTTNDDERTLGGLVVSEWLLDRDEDDLVLRAETAFDVVVKVRDVSTGEPIRNASVAAMGPDLVGGAYLTSSDEAGNAVLKGVLSGELRLRVGAEGYETRKLTSAVTRANAAVDVALTRTASSS